MVMRSVDLDAVLNAPETSAWLRRALTSAMKRDPIDAASDAAVLAKLLDRHAMVSLRQEVRAEMASPQTRRRPLAIALSA